MEMGIDVRDLPLRVGVFGAEPWSENMRKQIEHAMGITAIDIYGLSEVMGPGVAAECVHQNGLHVFEDHFLVEIVDTETLEPVPDGEYGEVVFTTLTKEGIPIVRYRTRDISRIIAEPCTCGRTFRRMERISGRYRRHAHHPRRQRLPEPDRAGSRGRFQVWRPTTVVVLSKRGSLDHVQVQVEVAPEFGFDEVRELERLQKRVKARDRVGAGRVDRGQARRAQVDRPQRGQGQASRRPSRRAGRCVIEP